MSNFTNGPRWTAQEDKTVTEAYPEGGALLVQSLLPHRSLNAIKQRACRLEVTHAASAHSHPPGSKGSAVPAPAPHEYTDIDKAWMSCKWTAGGRLGPPSIGRALT